MLIRRLEEPLVMLEACYENCIRNHILLSLVSSHR